MTWIAILVVVLLLLEYTAESVSDWLSLQRSKEVPKSELTDSYSPDRLEKITNYFSDRARFRWIRRSVSLVVLLAFWFTGGFPLLDETVSALGFSSVLTGILFFGIIGVVLSIIDLPFSLYGTFNIEAKFGFNQSTVATFWSDKIKGILLTIILGTPFLAAVLYFLESFPVFGWAIAWAVVTVVSLVLSYVAPTWIMPLFNTFTPVPADSELRSAIDAYSRSVDFPVQNVFVVDGSRRSSKSNAFFTGFGKQRRVGLFDTLVEKHSVPELIGVLAHEIGHYKHRHILIGTLVGIVQTGIMFFLLSLVLNQPIVFESFYLTQHSIYAGMLIFGILVSPVSFLSGIAFNLLSRKNEYEADRFAVSTIQDPDAFINALKTLSDDHLALLNPHPLSVLLFYSHPPLLSRIRAIRDYLACAQSS